MRTVLGALQGGQSVSAVLASARYGTFSIVGTVRENLAGDLALGGHILGGPLKKSLKDGAEIAHRSPVSELRALDSSITDEQGSDVAPETVRHGDFVSVNFNHHVHGDFTIVGVATEGNDPFVVLAQWLVCSRERATVFSTSTRLIRRAGDHTEVVPTRRGAMDALVVDRVE